MSDSDSFWRKAAGLRLSGAPSVEGGHAANDGARPSNGPDEDRKRRRDLVTLSDAIDLVTEAQGFGSPAVPPLVRAMIEDVRKLGAANGLRAAETVAGEAVAGEAAADAEPAATRAAEEPEMPDNEDVAETGIPGFLKAVPSEGAEEAQEAPPANDAAARVTELEERIAATDVKVASLTTAVGQLVAVLQQRTESDRTAERRTARRVPGQNAKVFVNERPYEVLNWSNTGFLIRIGDMDRFSRRGFDVHFVLELPDETIEFQGRATPIRIERDTLAAEFSDLDAATAAKMAEVAEQLTGAASA